MALSTLVALVMLSLSTTTVYGVVRTDPGVGECADFTTPTGCNCGEAIPDTDDLFTVGGTNQYEAVSTNCGVNQGCILLKDKRCLDGEDCEGGSTDEVTFDVAKDMDNCQLLNTEDLANSQLCLDDLFEFFKCQNYDESTQFWVNEDSAAGVHHTLHFSPGNSSDPADNGKIETTCHMSKNSDQCSAKGNQVYLCVKECVLDDR